MRLINHTISVALMRIYKSVIIPKFLAKAHKTCIHGTFRHTSIRSPNLAYNLLPGIDAVAVREQQIQQGILCFCQMHWFAIKITELVVYIDAELPKHDIRDICPFGNVKIALSRFSSCSTVLAHYAHVPQIHSGEKVSLYNRLLLY